MLQRFKAMSSWHRETTIAGGLVNRGGVRRRTVALPRFATAQRRGVVTVLTALLLVAIMGVAGLLLSSAALQLARAELQMATDAAARSAVIQLEATQSVDASRATAQDIAARFRVAGNSFALKTGEVAFGQTTRKTNGRYTFTKDASPMNSVRVQGRKTKSSLAGPVNLPFGGFVGHPNSEVSITSIAARLDYDLCLVLDRSGSMAWDLSQDRFSYPASIAHRPLIEKYFSPPEAVGSRWSVLSDCIDEFLGILATREVPAKVGLVTFASDYEFGQFQSVRVTTESDFTVNFNALMTQTQNIGTHPLIGGTDIAAGLEQARVLLTTSSEARPKTAHPAVVLFSDGIFNEGIDPVSQAASMYQSHGIVIHSVTFGAELPARQTMDQVAEVAGRGMSLHADTAAELLNSFRAIANSLPVMVTK